MAKRASGTQIRYGQTKRPRNLDGPPARPCTSGRRDVPNLVDRSSAVDFDLIRAAGCGSDWSNLSEGPAGLVAERLLADDVADYERFRAVCRAWRQCSTDPQAHSALDSRFHPRRWFMLREKLAAADPHRRRFMNLATGQCVVTSFPELQDHCAFGPTTEGLLVLVDQRTLVVRVLNPFTRQLTELPSVATLLPGSWLKSCYAYDLTYGHLSVRGAGLAGERTLALYFPRAKMLAVAKPGDERWTLVNRGALFFSASSFAGRFYCVKAGAVMVVKAAGNQPPQLVKAAKAKLSQPFSFMMDHTLHLVENDRRLMLVHRYRFLPSRSAGEQPKMKYNVYRVDLDARDIIPVNGLGGHASFIGAYRALSVSSDVFTCITANTVYPGFEFNENTDNENKAGAYHLVDGSTEPSVSCYDTLSGSKVARPYRIADCLSYHIKGYQDEYDEPLYLKHRVCNEICKD